MSPCICGQQIICGLHIWGPFLSNWLSAMAEKWWQSGTVVPWIAIWGWLPKTSQALMLKCLITFQKRLTCSHSGTKYLPINVLSAFQSQNLLSVFASMSFGELFMQNSFKSSNRSQGSSRSQGFFYEATLPATGAGASSGGDNCGLSPEPLQE